MSGLPAPGILKWDGRKFIIDPDIEIEGPPGPPGLPGVAGVAGSSGTPGATGPAGSSGIIASDDIDLPPQITFGDNVSTGISVAGNPLLGSVVTVYLNGVARRLGDEDITEECYFSSDGGVTAKAFTEIVFGDVLYWNESVAGINLSPSDRIDLLYLKSS